ncbi:MAG: response regulator [Lentisphaeria bacterium]|nr:response regulator [Lentisphaeria bacterium]
MQFYCLYSTIAAIALGIHMIINWQQLFCWKKAPSRLGARECSRFLLWLAAFFATDILWGIFAALQYPRLLFADTSVFFLLMALSVRAWTRYVTVYLEMTGKTRTALLWTGNGLLLLFIAALVMNCFTNIFFCIDEKGVYSSGPLRDLAYTLLIVFNLVCSVLTLAKLLHTKGAIRRRNKMAFVFGLIMTVTIALQFVDAFLPLYSLGSLFGCCLLHVFVFEDERDEMQQKNMLARDYEVKLRAEQTASQARSLFFSSVSHDIRTPLNAIVGFSELLEKGVADEAERARCIASIRSSSKVLARLVDDILDLSKLEIGKLEIIEEPTDVPTLVREVIAACEVARARKSLALKTEIGEMPIVSLDPQRIRQLLFNLLSNAYKYTDRGEITVRVSWQEGGTLVLSVADTGKGISGENLTRILQPFVQLADRNHRDGTGLGLAICRKLTTLMNGELTVDSKIGAGSTFTVTLRNVRTAELAVKSPKSSSEPNLIERLGHFPSRILVVDDSPVNRAVLKAMLAKIGITDITMAQNGKEALSVLTEDPKFDLVFTDLWMPEMDGSGLVHAIRADEKLMHLPVFLITADVEARTQTEGDGFTGVILKPVTLQKIQSLFS